MSSIVSSLTGGGGAGDAFKPSSANILNPATTDQANQQYQNAQTGLANQAGFLQAVQAQNGLANQSNVYNQLQGVSNGTGPNPAQSMLNQSTGQNVANQAALMAGQRGAGANAGLIARQAAMAGGNIQQQAAGQAATLQSQQQLNALNSMGSLATNQANQQANATNSYSNAAQGEQQNILGAIGAQNNANVGMTSNQNTTAGGLANTVSGQQGNLIGNLAGGAGGALISSFADGGEVDDSSDDSSDGGSNDSSMSSEPDTIDATKAAYEPAQSLAQTTSNLQNAFSPAGGGATTALQQSKGASSGPSSNVGRQFMNQQQSSQPNQNLVSSSYGQPSGAGGSGGLGGAGALLGKGAGSLIGQGLQAAGDYIFGGGLSSGISTVAGGAGDALGTIGTAEEAAAPEEAAVLAARGGKVKALLSPGETYLPPKAVKKAEKGANPLAVGQRIPGKPKHPGNNYANDTVPAKLSPGGIVIPNSIMQSKNPAKGAADFVRQIQNKNHMKKAK